MAMSRAAEDPTIAPKRRPHTWAHVAALVGVALLPKCPLCLLALLGLWGAVEGSTSAEERFPWVTRLASWPVLQVFSALVLVVILVALQRRHGIRTAAGAALVAGLLWASKFVIGSSLLVGVFAAALGAVVVWSRLRRLPRTAQISSGDTPPSTADSSGGCGCGCAPAKGAT